MQCMTKTMHGLWCSARIYRPERTQGYGDCPSFFGKEVESRCGIPLVSSGLLQLSRGRGELTEFIVSSCMPRLLIYSLISLGGGITCSPVPKTSISAPYQRPLPPLQARAEAELTRPGDDRVQRGEPVPAPPLPRALDPARPHLPRRPHVPQQRPPAEHHQAPGDDDAVRQVEAERVELGDAERGVARGQVHVVEGDAGAGGRGVQGAAGEVASGDGGRAGPGGAGEAGETRAQLLRSHGVGRKTGEQRRGVW